ncbi:MAG TPA: hypothetical protein VFJ64_01620 [Solirubrobacterales bacterium]|nr:hypothetical protein [Solirubrobacterales bacterium]
MDAVAPDSTQDWLLSDRSRPPLIGELERRIDEALATARASEAAVMTVGAAALDAAEQARRAAELAERASAMVVKARGPVASPPIARVAVPTAPPRAPVSDSASGEESLKDFSERADRLVARLRQLQRIPLAEPAASDAAGRPQFGR